MALGFIAYRYKYREVLLQVRGHLKEQFKHNLWFFSTSMDQ